MTEYDIEIENIAVFSGMDPEFVKEFHALKPEKLELSGAIITGRTIQDYKDMIKIKVQPVI